MPSSSSSFCFSYFIFWLNYYLTTVPYELNAVAFRRLWLAFSPLPPSMHLFLFVSATEHQTVRCKCVHQYEYNMADTTLFFITSNSHIYIYTFIIKLKKKNLCVHIIKSIWPWCRQSCIVWSGRFCFLTWIFLRSRLMIEEDFKLFLFAIIYFNKH